MGEITDAASEHANRIFKNLKIKKLDEYHDLYVQSDTWLLADVFENFWNMSWNIWTWDCYFFAFPGLPWQEELKNTKAKLHLSTDFDTALMVEKGIRGGICYFLIC